MKSFILAVIPVLFWGLFLAAAAAAVIGLPFLLIGQRLIQSGKKYISRTNKNRLAREGGR